MYYTFKYHKDYLKLLKEWDIKFDNYTITHNPIHIKFCQEFYKKIYENGHIFKQESKHFYCPQCKRFLPDRFVEGTCPICNSQNVRGDQCTNPDCGRLLTPKELLNPYCTNCGTKPILKETSHWYLNLPEFSHELIQFLDGEVCLSESSKNFAKRFIEDGLKPRPITRDLTWGIPVESIFNGAEGKVLYVWAEAVLGYISATKEWYESIGKPKDWKKVWQNKETKTIFCIGKDNTIFHSIIFPALLLASEEPYVLPHGITISEFIMFEGQPFSKSKGIGVAAEEAINIADTDYWRYYLIINRPETKDLNFTWDSFIERVNTDLNNVIGNFIHRTLTFISNNYDGIIPKKGNLNKDDKDLLELISVTTENQERLFMNFKLKESLKTVLSLARAGNNYLSSREPWKTIKTDKKSADNSINISVQIVNALAILIQPYLPSTSKKIRKMLNLPEEISIREIEGVADSPILSGHSISKPEVLFKKIAKEGLLKRRGNR
ncbi:MAG: methionine--tRNA ligase [Promethearchaeota archaeon]|jgi:methionyl-tRNA synthetase